MKGSQPLHQQSAGGGVYVAEERLKAASYINSWPQNEHFHGKCHFARN